ncbi:MAG: TetR/AcrR family transcriptional regulator [Alphaproteobacteria bacterium]|nr:TetR/AcrR family transcriptional regulator [Alphaproteobacteria bacterium]NNF23945.1 TetR/AcrR family transcriptional regulator [Paracoccaceae bacterium]
MQAKDKVTAKTGYHHGDLRQQLVTATRQLVEEKGQDNFSVSDACRKAGVSTAAPYRHFSDRQEMLHAVALEGMAEMKTAFDAALEGKTPCSKDAIAAIGEAYVAFAVAHPGMFRMMFAHHDPDETLKTRGDACYGVLLQQVGGFIGVPADAEEGRAASFPLWTFVHGLAFLAIDRKVEFADMSVQVPQMVQLATDRLLVAKS